MIIHLLLEILAGGLLIYIWYIASKLYPILKDEWLRYLSICWYAVGILNIWHWLLSVSGLLPNLAFFIPSTWLLGKILFSSILIMAFFKPNNINLITSFIFGSIIWSFALVIPYSWVYYMDSWIMGRPAEWLPFFISIFWLIVCYYKKCGTLCKYIAYTLLLTLVTQITMVYSHWLFDSMFTIAHIFQIFSIVPLLFYLNKKLWNG